MSAFIRISTAHRAVFGVLTSAVLVAACGPQLALNRSDDSGSTGDSEANATTTTGPGPTPPPVPTPNPGDSSESTDGAIDDGSGSTSVSFIGVPDGGGDGFVCDIYTQDCPPGHKCAVWSSTGGSNWDSTRCVPLVDDPVAVGDPCTVEGSATTGLDDCELGTMCWDVDPRTNEGVCVALCTGSSIDPVCDDPQTYCNIPGDGPVTLCLPLCNPLQQDCAEGQGCYPIQGEWTCIPTASSGKGGYGAPCEYINACDHGFACLGSPALPNCAGSFGCCSQACDVEDHQCPDAELGVTCVPWYEPEYAPPGFENVGVCALPE